MVILDTSIWIEYFKKSDPYFTRIAELLINNEILAVSCIFGELLQGAKSNRERRSAKEFWEALPNAPEENLMVKAGELSGRNMWYSKSVGLIDCMIITASRDSSAFVWSLDKKLNRLLKKEEIFS